MRYDADNLGDISVSDTASTVVGSDCVMERITLLAKGSGNVRYERQHKKNYQSSQNDAHRRRFAVRPLCVYAG